jgi:hypothetical protein
MREGEYVCCDDGGDGAGVAGSCATGVGISIVKEGLEEIFE